MAAMVNMTSLLNGKDSRWLQLEVCREFQRNKCSRQDTECKFAHPPANVEVQNGKVTACYDSIKVRDGPDTNYYPFIKSITIFGIYGILFIVLIEYKYKYLFICLPNSEYVNSIFYLSIFHKNNHLTNLSKNKHIGVEKVSKEFFFIYFRFEIYDLMKLSSDHILLYIHTNIIH